LGKQAAEKLDVRHGLVVGRAGSRPPLAASRETARAVGPQRGRGEVLECSQHRLVGLVRAGQFEDALLGLAQLIVTAPHQADSLLVPRQRFLKADLPVFEIADDEFQLVQRLLEGSIVPSLIHGGTIQW
jgi:hypothetical protein